MSKNFILVSLMILITCGKVSSQIVGNKNSRDIPSAAKLHEVSGVVMDSIENPIAGAVIKLFSTRDTLTVHSNERGIFILKNVKETEFLLTIASLGHAPMAKKYFFNQNTLSIILDPVILGDEVEILKEIVVNGTPTIVYKTDTTEYRASDYKVKDNATVDELLKKMEGVSLGRDKSLYYLGLPISTLKINGKRFGDGSVAQTIQSLPAEIVEKAQFIDDYGDEAARTGVKNGDPSKILNLTTKADKSIANIARATLGAGSRERYDNRIFLQRLNANQQIGLIGNMDQTLNGIAVNQAAIIGTPGAGSGSNDSGGKSQNQKSTLNYRDQWGEYIQVNSFYTYDLNKINSTSLNNGNLFSSNGTTLFSSMGERQGRSQNHRFSFEMDLTPDSANFIRVVSGYNRTATKENSSQLQNFVGYLNQTVNNRYVLNNAKPSFDGLLLYQHLFKKERRNISIQINFFSSNQDDLNENRANIIYQDITQMTSRDSLQHLQVNRINDIRNYRSSLTYVEPLTTFSRLELNAQINRRASRNETKTDSISLTGQNIPIFSLENIYRYSFTESRVSLSYRLLTKKQSLSLGVTVIPTFMKGDWQNTDIKNNNFNLVPILRYEYVFSKTERASINYSGNPVEATPFQLQPVTDRSDPQNIVIGNPYLKPSFHHIVNLMYNHFIPNSKMNVSLNGNIRIVKNKVTTNILQIPLANVNGSYNEIGYFNVNGTYDWTLNHSVSKQIGDGKFIIEISGQTSYSKQRSASNNIVYSSDSWFVRETLGTNLIPKEWLEINPYISYGFQKRIFAQPNAINSHIITTAVNLDGRVFLGSWKIGYEASKIFVKGIEFNKSKNPFVVNIYLEKALLQHNNGLLRLQLFDLFKQNNLINQIANNYGTTNNVSSTLSRYGFLSFTYTLQKWSGSPKKKNGETRKRKGDGSFIY